MGPITSILGLSPIAWMIFLGSILPAYVLGICIYRIWLHPLSKFPGPILAKITNLYGGYHAWKGDLHVDMWRCHDKYGNYVRYAPDRILFNSNTGLKEIYSYNATFRKSDAYGAMVHRAPNTLTLIDKKAHGRKRRIIAQGFSEAALRSYEPTILTHIRKFGAELESDSSSTENWKDVSESRKWSKPHNMARWSNYLTFDIMTDVIFGESYALLERIQYRHIVKCIEESNVRTGVLLQAGELVTGRLDRRLFPEAIKGRNTFISFVTGLLKRRMQAQPLKRKDVFSFLLGAKDPETQQEMKPAEIGAEATTMIVAGSDTSSTAIASSFFYLSLYPKTYAKARDEVRAAFTSHEDVRLGSALNSCTYLRACIDESLRMSPPAGSSLWRRVCDKGTMIDGHFIPSGYDVGTCIYSIHHNADYYPDPFMYRPERWLEAGSTELARSAFNPFSVGPRGCIGKGLANTELMLTMAFMLSKFDFRRADGALGGGSPGAEYGRHRETEYQLYDHVTAAKDGPWIQVCKRV